MSGLSPTKRGASSSVRPPPATAPRPQPAVPRMFTSANTSPRSAGRTPRASLAAVAAPRSIPHHNNPSSRLSTLATPAAQLARSSRRAPLTPATTSAATRNAQLVRTPATIRAQAKLARGGASGWRASLMHGGADEARRKLEARRGLVQESAVDALERLLMVGRDGVGEDNGDWTIGEDDERLYEAFEAMKKAHLSSSVFLDTSALASAFPNEVVDSSSPLNSLARLSNFTTFLHLVLSSRPDPATGVAERAGIANLKQATEALLRHVKPLEEPVDDKAVDLLIDLKTQTFIAAASLSRTPIDPKPFFAAPLASHLPPSSSFAMTDRGATVKFSRDQSKRVQVILDTGSDWAALRTSFKWEETARHARDWVEEMLGKSGLSGVAERSLGSGGATSEGEYVEEDMLSAEETDQAAGVGLDDRDRGLADRAAQAQRATNDERADETESAEPEQAYDTASEDEEGEEDQLASASASVDGDQQDAAELEQDDEDFDEQDQDPLFLEASSQDESARVAQQLGVGAVRDVADSVAAAVSAQLADRADSLVDLLTLPGAMDSDPQDRNQMVIEGETVATVVTEVSDRAEELAAMLETQTNGLEAAQTDGQELSESLIDEFLVLDQEVGPAAATPRPATPASSILADQQQASPTPRPAQERSRPLEHVTEPSRLRFGAGNVLVRTNEPRAQRSLLERQADAEKIAFDSQSQSASPAPPPPKKSQTKSASSKGKGKEVASPLSPEGARSAQQALASPERDIRQSPSLEQSGDLAGQQQPVAGPSSFFPENDFFENEFGGGGSEFGGEDAALEGGEGALAGAGANSDDGRSERNAFIDFDDATGRRPAADREAPPRADRGQAKGKQRATTYDAEEPSTQARVAAFKAAGRAATTSRRAALAGRQEDGSSDSDSTDEDARERRRARHQRLQPRQDDGSSGHKRRRSEEVLSDDDAPAARKQKSSGRRERSPASPQQQARPSQSGNMYAFGRNEPGGRISWTTKEERLLEKLIQSYGSNWARMMELHGPNGTTTRTFRHRNNVALKDKAVNMKVKILRAGGNPPSWMSVVRVPKNKLPKTLPQGPRPNETDDESSE
ncbi:Proteophosphoglycan ppg4 [Rhodotorula toruloides ATCC 204091]|uniref:Proteophosphoglycan ppg4 n=1 Tax=Rhodotorula toruloides TaxID=5286 RepID=A0A0K3CT94_RHOTO|nr:Proteophosphoglycan ppg4 [Rhodotorula toruloides ATCC 204091]PRQ71054.1 Proteophosphoglycan ppg4 [Rhodotorula toruloides]